MSISRHKEEGNENGMFCFIFSCLHTESHYSSFTAMVTNEKNAACTELIFSTNLISCIENELQAVNIPDFALETETFHKEGWLVLSSDRINNRLMTGLCFVFSIFGSEHLLFQWWLS